MLAAISRALEERDQTQGHGARVAALAEPIAHRLGWGADRITALRFGAVHHDIGKVAVRRDLLRKSGPLTLDELAEIRTHPSAGAELVQPLRGARHALPYVLFHHERWDGTGYPSRLRGRAIPLEGRLLSVADAFDAMTSPRPYRQALTHESALLELCSCAGSQFDPEVAELFLEVWSVEVEAWPAAVAS
jgi:HD-GYP domain-containing protein (c-di-GMP phosphodiesterase class II)